MSALLDPPLWFCQSVGLLFSNWVPVEPWGPFSNDRKKEQMHGLALLHANISLKHLGFIPTCLLPSVNNDRCSGNGGNPEMPWAALRIKVVLLCGEVICTGTGLLCMCVLSLVRLFATSWTVALQAPLSMGFSRQEYWSGLPCPPPGDLPDPKIKPRSPAALASQPDSLLWATGEAPLASAKLIYSFLFISHSPCLCVCLCIQVSSF